VLNEVKAANLNVQRMENIVFAGAEAAIARIELDGTLEPETMDRVRGNSDIIEVNLLAL
jgi:D-3-phosphoglycerate dehydrogenase